MHARGYIFSTTVFRPSLYHRGYVDYHIPLERTPDNISNSEVSQPPDTIHPRHAHTGMDTGTSMEATAAPNHSGPIAPAARTPPVPAAAAPRARITSLLSGSILPTGTGTGTATPAVAQTPTTGISTREEKMLWQQHPTLQPQGLETPAAAPELPATPPYWDNPCNTTPCYHTPCSLPGSVHTP